MTWDSVLTSIISMLELVMLFFSSCSPMISNLLNLYNQKFVFKFNIFLQSKNPKLNIVLSFDLWIEKYFTVANSRHLVAFFPPRNNVYKWENNLLWNLNNKSKWFFSDGSTSPRPVFNSLCTHQKLCLRQQQNKYSAQNK